MAHAAGLGATASPRCCRRSRVQPSRRKRRRAAHEWDRRYRRRSSRPAEAQLSSRSAQSNRQRLEHRAAAAAESRAPGYRFGTTAFGVRLRRVARSRWRQRTGRRPGAASRRRDRQEVVGGEEQKRGTLAREFAGMFQVGRMHLPEQFVEQSLRMLTVGGDRLSAQRRGFASSRLAPRFRISAAHRRCRREP